MELLAYGIEVAGSKKKGWFHWYYLDPVTGVMATGWVQVVAPECTHSASGACSPAGAGSWCYLAPLGCHAHRRHTLASPMLLHGDSHVANWRVIDGRWYYCASSVRGSDPHLSRPGPGSVCTLSPGLVYWGRRPKRPQVGPHPDARGAGRWRHGTEHRVPGDGIGRKSS